MNPPSDNIFIRHLPADIDEGRLCTIFGAYGKIKTSRLLPGQGNRSALIRYSTLDEAVWIVEHLNGNIAQGLDSPIQVNYARPPGGGDSALGGDGATGDRFSPYGGKGGSPVAAWDPTVALDQGACSAATWSKGGCNADVPSWAAGWGLNTMKGGCGGGFCGMCKSKGKGKFGQPSNAQGLRKSLEQAGVLPGGKIGRDESVLYIGNLPYDTTDKDLYQIFACFGAIIMSGVKAMTNEDGSCKGIGFVNFQDVAAAQFAISSLNGTSLPDGSRLKVSIKMPKPQTAQPTVIAITAT